MEEQTQLSTPDLLRNVASYDSDLDSLAMKVDYPLYHGSCVSGITDFGADPELAKDLGDYMGSSTLGPGLYTTDDKNMAINYAFHRSTEHNAALVKKHDKGFKPSVYALSISSGNKFLDLDSATGIEAMVGAMARYCTQNAEALRKKISLYTWIHLYNQRITFDNH